jgi:hypothetical protein
MRERAKVNGERSWRVARTRAVAVALLACVPLGRAEGQPAGAPEPAALSRAKAVFDRFVALENARDMALLDLVADDATILIRSENADGQWRELRTPCREWKEMLRQVTALGGPGPARDQHGYVNCTSAAVGKSVRMACTRPKEDANPARLSLLIGPGRQGKWLIHEYVLEAPYARR